MKITVEKIGHLGPPAPRVLSKLTGSHINLLVVLIFNKALDNGYEL